MGYKTAYREVIREYENDRDSARHNADARRDALYAQIPRIREIDTQLSVAGVSLARYAMSGDTDNIVRVRAESDELVKEKAELLAQNSFPKDYLDLSHKCGVCGDTGFVEREDRRFERCSCFKQRLIDKYYDLSNLRSILKEENFDAFVLDYYDTKVNEETGMSPHEYMQMVYGSVNKFVNEFGKNFQNLFFFGKSGLGKTFICNCIAKDLLDKGYTVLYMTAPRLFKIVEDFRFRRDESEMTGEMVEIVDTASEVDLLIIDDLGAEFDTVVTSASLFDIINQRLTAKKPTVISTNLDEIESLNDMYSDRVISRLWGNFKIFKFFGDDIRLKKKYHRSNI